MNPLPLLVLSRFVRLLLLIALSLWIIGCGGEREEPFDESVLDTPDGDDSSNGSDSDDPDNSDDPDDDTVSVSLLVESTETRLVPERTGRRLEVLRNSTDFFDRLDIYATTNVQAPDFERGQVVLYDAGDVDDRDCVHRMPLEDVSAERVNDEITQVVLSHSEQPPENDTQNCPDDPVWTRPYHFYYVESTARLILVEELK